MKFKAIEKICKASGGTGADEDMRKLLKRFICKHKWEIVRKVEKFSSLKGEQLYRRCEKCGKLEKYIYRYYEGNGYK